MKKQCFKCKKEFEKDYRTSKKHFLTLTKYCDKKCMNLARKGKHNSPDTEMRKGQCISPQTQFKKGDNLNNTNGFTTNKVVGMNNINWKGDKVGYGALHSWVARKLGKAFWCTWCFSMQSIHWANISHEYKRDVLDWMQLCARCHSRFDRKSDYGIATLMFPNIKRTRKTTGGPN